MVYVKTQLAEVASRMDAKPYMGSMRDIDSVASFLGVAVPTSQEDGINLLIKAEAKYKVMMAKAILEEVYSGY